jgi:hypothetical protein
MVLAAAERFAASATPARLAMALCAVAVAFLLNAVANMPVEQALRAGDCQFIDCLRPLRPEARHAGYSAAEFRDFLAAIGPLRRHAAWALITDLPLIAAIAGALLIAAGLATRALPLSERSQRILVLLPLAFAVVDLVEDTLLASAYSGLADLAGPLPWISALKFGLLVASVALSLVLGLVRAVQN